MKKILLAGVATLFLATGAAQAGVEEQPYFLAVRLKNATPRDGEYDCATMTVGKNFKDCKAVRQSLLKENVIVSQCRRTEEEAKAELANVRWN
jgi:hypothetical protein